MDFGGRLFPQLGAIECQLAALGKSRIIAADAHLFQRIRREQFTQEGPGTLRARLHHDTEAGMVPKSEMWEGGAQFPPEAPYAESVRANTDVDRKSTRLNSSHL